MVCCLTQLKDTIVDGPERHIKGVSTKIVHVDVLPFLLVEAVSVLHSETCRDLRFSQCASLVLAPAVDCQAAASAKVMAGWILRWNAHILQKPVCTTVLMWSEAKRPLSKGREGWLVALLWQHVLLMPSGSSGLLEVFWPSRGLLCLPDLGSS
eukprot:2933601-Amphidinium_carterae.3